jgi:hypothetical protein
MAQDVDAAESLDGRRQRRLHLLAIQQVCREERAPRFDPEGRLEGVGVTIDQDKACTLLFERRCHGPSQVTGGPGDHDGAVLEAHGFAPWRRLL